jgi:hypothetical protein
LLLLFNVVVVIEYIPVRIVLIVGIDIIECIPEFICFDINIFITGMLLLLLLIRTTYRTRRRGEVRFDRIRLRFDSISIGCTFGTNSARFRISFDSIIIQFDSIRFDLHLLWRCYYYYYLTCFSLAISTAPTWRRVYCLLLLFPSLIDRRIEWKDGVKWYLWCTKSKTV